ncbi:uncharacterized protein PHACADRAFT_198629 [Phanerochaete carnosa HHB-10118-sp]|uniref:PARP catalytic domain-containing protein n=1 Tax=Phanerochaete carnosa (strain HHB-10118-sp) TaxID=650164 RepID=K5URQ3_PHACS|nr:uncharacterized protein PHACADRAFT_198629 [Phanerochaete carnosa HHB-10118-sp]EKM52576.1 hypothetical protein PHACADRAFT_198629 [Phanerochaete carnosa HHB-10118-sp]
MSSNTCALAGCFAAVWVDRNGVPSQYCSRSHMSAATQHPPQSQQSQLCKNCGVKPVFVENGKGQFLPVFCTVKMCQFVPSESKQWAPSEPGRHVSSRRFFSKCHRHMSNLKVFYEQWKHPNKKRPEVVKVYKVYPQNSHMQRFQAYKARVPDNSRRRWHGTTRRCRIGDSAQNLNFCFNAQCAMCNILQTSFDLSRAARGPGSYQRFGAVDYIDEAGGSSYRAMILTDVTMGKAAKLRSEDRTLTQAPPGYDSVVGEPGFTSCVKYDEAVVYKNEAIRPLYLVILKP